MPMDDADEFGEKMLRASASIAREIMRDLGRRNGAGKSLAKEIEDCAAKRKEKAARPDSLTDDADVQPAGQPLAVEAEDPYIVLSATSAEEATFIAGELSRAGISFMTTASNKRRLDGKEIPWPPSPDEDGLIDIYVVRDEALASACPPNPSPGDRDFTPFLEAFSRESALAKLGIGEACSKTSRMIVPEAFEPGRRGNVKFGFGTVRWDPEGNLMRSFLDKAGIPYAASHANDGWLTFEVARGHAGAVRSVIDGMCENVRGMSRERIGEYDSLAAAESSIEGRAIGAAEIADPQAAEIVHAQLDEMGIEYATTVDPETGVETLFCSTEEIESHAELFPEAVRSAGAVTPAMMRAAAKGREAMNAQARARAFEQRRAPSKSRRQAEAAKSRAVPARDQERMQRAVEAQKVARQNKNRTVSR